MSDKCENCDLLLAQVAVLVQALENVLYAQLGGHLNPTDDGKKVLNTIRPLQSQTPLEARARDLLNRLQRAEAVVEALKLHMQWVGPPPIGPQYYDYLREDAWEKGTKALNAWEETNK